MMKIFALVVVLICAAVVSAIHRDIKLGRRAVPDGTCQLFFKTCPNMWVKWRWVFYHFSEGTQVLLQDESKVDEFCSDSEHFTQCVEDVVTQCPDDVETQNRELADAAAVTYLCSEEGRANLQEMMESPCAPGNEKEKDLDDLYWECEAEFDRMYNEVYFNTETSDEPLTDENDPDLLICPYVEEKRVCGQANVTELCGDAFGTYMNHMWDTYYANDFGDTRCRE